MRLVLTLLILLPLKALAADPYDIRDKAEFAKVIPDASKLEKLATDMKFLEGPVWSNDDGGFLLFSDIPSNQIKRWSDKGGLSVFRDPSNYSNGNTRDNEGRLITCEHAARRVTRTEKDGSVTVLADKYDGKRFNSPNDVVVKSDGTIWFTDPPYGTPKGEAKELDKNYVFRLDPKTKELKAVIADCDMPNGLAFSPDQKTLYVADSGKPKHIRAFAVAADNALTGGDVFCKIDNGAPDGIRVDADGRVLSSAGDGVHVFAKDGKLIGKILVPETPANLCFGGADGHDLYITAKTSLYRIKLADDDMEPLLKNMVSKLDEVTAVLKGVNDQASARAAAPKVKTLLDEYLAMNEKGKTTRTNASEQTRLETTYKPLLFDAGKRFGEQYSRILMDPKSQSPELMAALDRLKNIK